MSIDKPPPPTHYSSIMASERIQRHIDSLLDEADQAVANEDWPTVASRARAVLRMDPENSDGLSSPKGKLTATLTATGADNWELWGTHVDSTLGL